MTKRSVITVNIFMEHPDGVDKEALLDHFRWEIGITETAEEALIGTVHVRAVHPASPDDLEHDCRKLIAHWKQAAEGLAEDDPDSVEEHENDAMSTIYAEAADALNGLLRGPDLSDPESVRKFLEES